MFIKQFHAEPVREKKRKKKAWHNENEAGLAFATNTALRGAT